MRSVKKTIKSSKTKAALHALERSGTPKPKTNSSKQAVEPKLKKAASASSRTLDSKREATKTNSSRTLSAGGSPTSNRSAASSKSATLKRAVARQTSTAIAGKMGGVANNVAASQGAGRTSSPANNAAKADPAAAKSIQPKRADALSEARRPRLKGWPCAKTGFRRVRLANDDGQPGRRRCDCGPCLQGGGSPSRSETTINGSSNDPGAGHDYLEFDPRGRWANDGDKKIEKKTSVGSSSNEDAMVTPTNDSATPVTLASAAKTAAVGKATKTPVAKAASSLATPPQPPQSVNVEAARSQTAESAKTVEPKPNEKVVAPASKTGRASSAARQGFKPNEFIVYPAHGVGQIVAIEEQEVAGFKLELFVISFVKDKMILKVPTPKVVSVGMRKLAEADVVKKALDTLTGRARVKRTMWSRRAQEYEAKINSGDLISIAEVVRDLYRSDAQPEQSYSERQLYEAALDRMAREIVVVQKLTETESLKAIEAQLQKGPRRGKTEDIDTDEADIEEAA